MHLIKLILSEADLACWNQEKDESPQISPDSADRHYGGGGIKPRHALGHQCATQRISDDNCTMERPIRRRAG
jgi:hypothetical protein